jgi:ATP-binding cassette subfamily B protein
MHPSKTLRLLRRFWPYLRRRRGVLCVDLLCALFGSAAELVLPLLVRHITNTALLNPKNLSLRFFALTGGAYALMRLADAAATYFMNAQGHYMGAKIETDMRNDLFAHLQSLPFSYYDNTKIGQLMSRLTSDLFDVTEFAHHMPEYVVLVTVRILACFLIFSRMSPWLALLVVLLVPAMFFITHRARKRMKLAFQQQRRQVGEINAQAEDSLQGIRVVKSFGNEETEAQKFRRSNARFFGFKRNGFAAMAQKNATVRLCDGLLYLAAVLLGA